MALLPRTRRLRLAAARRRAWSAGARWSGTSRPAWPRPHEWWADLRRARRGDADIDARTGRRRAAWPSAASSSTPTTPRRQSRSWSSRESVVGRRQRPLLADHDRAGRRPTSCRVASRCRRRPEPPRGVTLRRRVAERRRSGRRRSPTRCERIGAGELDKVVLARDLLASRRTNDIDPRWLVQRLADAATRSAGPIWSTAWSGPPRRCWSGWRPGWPPPGCWPAPSGATGDDDRRSESGRRAWRSPARTWRSTSTPCARSPRALAPYCSGMNVPDAPYVLELPNVLHLATDVTAVADPAASSLHARRGAAPQRRGLRHADRCRPRADRRARAPRPRDVRRVRSAGSTPAATASGRSRCAAGRSTRPTRARSGCSPAAASWPDPIRRPSWPSPTPSSSRCGSPSARDSP